jgi:hypothetical protein
MAWKISTRAAYNLKGLLFWRDFIFSPRIAFSLLGLHILYQDCIFSTRTAYCPPGLHILHQDCIFSSRTAYSPPGLLFSSRTAYSPPELHNQVCIFSVRSKIKVINSVKKENLVRLSL